MKHLTKSLRREIFFLISIYSNYLCDCKLVSSSYFLNIMLYTPTNGKMNAGRQYVKELSLGEWSSPNGLKEPDRAKKYLNKVSWQPIPFMTPWSPDSQLELPQIRQRARPLALLTSHWKGAHPSQEVGGRTLNLFSLKEGNFWTRASLWAISQESKQLEMSP